MNRELYNKLIQAAEIKAGSLVLVQYWGEDLLAEDITNIQTALVQNGCTPVLFVQSRNQNQEIFSVARKECYDDHFFKLLEAIDVVIDLMEHPVSMLNTPLPKDQMAICGQYMKKLFGIITKKEKCIQICIPTEANARDAGLPFKEYQKRMTSAYQIDYRKLKEACILKRNEFSKTDHLTLKTGPNLEYALSVTWTGREWLLDCGDGDLPCGEIYVAPNEGTASGKIYYGTLYIDAKRKYSNVLFTIQNGAILTSDHPEVNAFLQELQPEDKVICELGFGMNPNVTDLCGCTLLDEKMADTFHIAIGNNIMFGGTNTAEQHLDLVGKAIIELGI